MLPFRDMHSDLIEAVITPRFVPTCTTKLMTGLGKLASETGAPVQSHISESIDAVAFSTHLHPEVSCQLQIVWPSKVFVVCLLTGSDGQINLQNWRPREHAGNIDKSGHLCLSPFDQAFVSQLCVEQAVEAHVKRMCCSSKKATTCPSHDPSTRIVNPFALGSIVA